jgi:hypothetical protein
MHSIFTRAAAVRAALAIAVVAGAPAAASAQAQPTADQVIERYVTAIGGRAAVMAQTSSRTVARMEIPAMGMGGTVEVLVASPGNMIQKLTLAGMGESQTGVTNGRGWSIDAIQGARLVTGAEAEQLLHSTEPTVALRDPKHFTSRDVIGEQEFDGEKCVAVRFVWTSGRESTDCYSVETGLLVATRSTFDSPMGSVEVLIRALDYKEYGGVRMPTTMKQTMMGMEQKITIESVEFGNVTAEQVTPPAAIRTMLEGAGS